MQLSMSSLLRKLEQQNHKCALSGESLTPDNVSLDHRAPVSKGGSHGIDNIQLVTTEVNRAKGTMTNDEFAAMCKAVVEHLGTQ
jgi:5-methylcytosine-specific restriction endonuclease McrA